MRAKIIAFTLAFFATVMTLGAGAYYIFGSLGRNLDVLSFEVQRHKYHQDLRSSIVGSIDAVTGWTFTGRPKYREMYLNGMGTLSARLDNVVRNARDKAEAEALAGQLKILMESMDSLIAVERPEGGRLSHNAIENLQLQESAVLSRLDGLHEHSILATLDVVSEGKRIRRNMVVYLVLLVAFGLLATGFLMLLMRRFFEGPYREMFEATEKIASGDLSYRIGSTRKDEFGIISNRFDAMVESLEQSSVGIGRKLKETELFLEVARIAGMVPELRKALDLMVVKIAGMLDKDFCAVFLLRAERNAFCIEACNREAPSDTCLPLESGIARSLLERRGPMIVADAKDLPEAEILCKASGSLMIAPIIRDENCIGILVLGKYEPFGFREEEISTVTIIAHTIATAVRNTELLEATKSQLNQLRIVYELSRTLTSVYEPDEILKTIAADIANLINAKGCVIRLIEDGMLRIKSSYGQLNKTSDVPMGKGVAGVAAEEGRPLLIEDISVMPEEMRELAMATKSVISVPLTVGEKIIGTLGLFDKLNEKGDAIPFTTDDLEIAKGFASISAIAIDKARMLEFEKKRETAIQEAEKRMNLLFESVQSGIISLDRDYTVKAANKYIERWIDKPLGEIFSKSAIEVFHEKGGICPHCAARATFETGDINSITQSSGLNYADLASYPVKDENGDVIEAVVFIQDITDRVLYQEEIMGLYREVMQAKEYIENLINSSADAIVTSDINGVVTSWNPAAEEIYGFRSAEVMGNFLPFIPDSLSEFERENIEKIKRGEVLKLETFRKKKDESVIEVSLTLSPIKDATGEIIGISGISRDISDKKRVEKELIRRNQELSRLFFISSAMRSTLDLDRLLRMVLTAVTMGDGLGFNRAILFLVDEDGRKLRGAMGVGPASPEEAWQVWERLSIEKRTLREIMRELEEGPLRKDSFLDRLTTGIEIPLSDDTILTRAVKEKKAVNVADVRVEPLSDALLIQQLGTPAYAAVPLLFRDKVTGLLWVDNIFNRRPISEEDMKFLMGFADQVASAIEAARLFQQVSRAEAELENIFRSISDMVYFTDKDYTVRNINEAVSVRFGLPPEEIVGHKCYEIFHGMNEPWPLCPHHKTVETMRPHVEELEDTYLKGTFLTSTSPIFETDGSFLGTVHVVRDVSELKKLREKLQSSERMAALGEVAAKVAHEIRNPLVSVGGFAKRLENKLDGNLREYASIIANEVARLEVILKEILGFVKEVRVSKRLVDLNDVLRGIVELVGAEVQEKGNAVTTNFHEPALTMIIDPDRVKEAMFNIVSNANQATDGGTITISTYVEDGVGVAEVTDTGCGVREEDIDRIFDPFFTTRPTGTGLGLAIAKRIIEEHHGRITVRSKWPGEGTSFKIYLPIKEEKS